MLVDTLLVALLYGSLLAAYRRSDWRYTIDRRNRRLVAVGRTWGLRALEFTCVIPLESICAVERVDCNAAGMALVFWKGQALGNIRRRGVRLRLRGLTTAAQVPFLCRWFAESTLFLTPDTPDELARALTAAAALQRLQRS